MNYDSELAKQVEAYMAECEPVADKENNVINCTECSDRTCEYFYEYNEIEP